MPPRGAAEGYDVDRWDIDVEGLQRDPQFPGMEVARSAAIGLTATLAGDGTGPTLMLNGHTDVVPPGDIDAWSGDPFTPRLMTVDGDDRIVARGACDMKAGVVAMWHAVRAVKKAGIPLRGNVILAAVSGEEDGGLGTFALLRHGVTADMCVVPEPTAMDVIPANGGALTFRLTVRGLATHAARRTEGVSAIEKFYPRPARPAGPRATPQRGGRRRHAAVAAGLPAVDRHHRSRRLGLDRAGPAHRGRPTRRRPRRDDRAGPRRARGHRRRRLRRRPVAG